MKKAYDHLFEPEEHPDFLLRHVRAVTRDDLGRRIHFTSARQFPPDPETFQLKPFQDYLDWYTRIYDLGDIIWPNYHFLAARDARTLVDEIKKRGLYVFDIWGYVPGSYSNFVSCGEVDYAPLAAYLQDELGERFLGFDNGEQDGRYIGSYATLMCPAGRDHQEQYDNFQHHFSFMHQHLQNDVAALCSLNLGHYFLKEQDVKLLGSECAQALQNVNVWYAFLRGAGKQYGVLWFGNASVWNRWGWKDYDPALTADHHGNAPNGGPEEGTSLSLLRRIIYTHYTYNCDILGFESGFMISPEKPGDVPQLSPIGQLNQAGHAFVKKYGYPGVQHTPVAVLFDFHNGWVPPRHLYTKLLYRTWGNEPYHAGDYQAHALFTMLYPQYEEAGYYRDETGFLTATPFGDNFDVLYSDAASAVLGTYNKLILAGHTPSNLEELNKLQDYVHAGGHLIIFAGQLLRAEEKLAQYQPGLKTWFGLAEKGELVQHPAATQVSLGGQPGKRQGVTFHSLVAGLVTEANILARTEQQALAYTVQRQKGKLTVILVPFGLNSQAVTGQPVINQPNQPIPRPYDFLPFVKELLGSLFAAEQLVRLDNEQLQYAVNLKSPDQLLLTVVNNTAQAQAYNILTVGQVSLEPVLVPDVKHSTAGYFAPEIVLESEPESFEKAWQLKPYDLAMFRISSTVELYQSRLRLEHKKKPENIYLRLNPNLSAQQQFNRMPTLGQHFAGVSLSARYFLDREEASLTREGKWLQRNGLDLILDCSGLFNHYPDWSQVDIVMERYARTMQEFTRCLDKAAAWGCNKVIIIMQRIVEASRRSLEGVLASVSRTLFYLADECQKRQMTLYIQNSAPGRLTPDMNELAEWLQKEQLRPIKLALNVSHALISQEDRQGILQNWGHRIHALLLSTPEEDMFGQMIDRHAPLFAAPCREETLGWTRAVQGSCQLDFTLLDCCYKDWNEIWSDLILLEMKH